MLQREVSPIPPGRYWIIVESQNIRDFDSWLRDMQGGVRIETASLDARAGHKASQFLIFNVPAGRMPFLNPQQFGFPSLAPPEVKSREDVIQNEQQPNPEDLLADSARRAAGAVGDFAGLALLLLLVVAAGALKR
jgi:hypothetical protein